MLVQLNFQSKNADSCSLQASKYAYRTATRNTFTYIKFTGVNVGRVRKCPINDLKFTILAHNTVIGAAGGSILNAELACSEGLIPKAS